METPQISQAIIAAEQALAEGRGLGGTGFWGAVSAVKLDPELTRLYGDRIAQVDQAAFQRWAWFRVSLPVGTWLMIAGTLLGLGLVAAAYYLSGLLAVVVFFAGVGALLTTTHGLGHLVVGAMVGIRFTGWFIGSPKRPQPGVKVDYTSYLATSPRRRAWMHASGAIVTKVIPFALLPAAVIAGLPAWSVWALAALGVVMVVTDIAWSTKSSDWKKFKREMALAQS